MTGLPLNGKVVNLSQLSAEMATAGLTVGHLGTADGDLFTYGVDGAPVDLPAGAAAVVAAHVPGPSAEQMQRAQAVAILLNSSAVRNTQQDRDAFAFILGVRSLTISLSQDATAADIEAL